MDVHDLHWTQAHTHGSRLHAKDREVQERTVVRFLQLCRAILHNERALGKDFKGFQFAMAKQELLLPVANLLSSTNDDVVREALALCVILLDGGNRAAQESFEDHFLRLHDSNFFTDVSERVKTAIEHIVEV